MPPVGEWSWRSFPRQVALRWLLAGRWWWYSQWCRPYCPSPANDRSLPHSAPPWPWGCRYCWIRRRRPRAESSRGYPEKECERRERYESCDTTPEDKEHSPPGQRRRLTTNMMFAGNPAISCLLQLETGGFASPPCDGFAH